MGWNGSHPRWGIGWTLRRGGKTQEKGIREVCHGREKRMEGARWWYGNDERDDGGYDGRHGRYPPHDGEVNADGTTDGRCHHRGNVNDVFCYS